MVSSKVVSRNDSIIKSMMDDRLYRAIELRNGLKVLLVSDEHTDKCAASLDIAVGAMSGPSAIPGLAHFCEHMLFLGTDKYPAENEFHKYVAMHGGSTNAVTNTDHTNYYFDVAPAHLQGALDRFAQFFLTPHFTESAIEREIHAVDSEFRNKIMNDASRQLMVEKTLSSIDHDWGVFSTGNFDTLPADPKTRQAVIDFYETHYSANIMTLCVVARQSLDEMEQMVIEMFADIADKKLEKKLWNHPYTNGNIGVTIQIVPVTEARELRLMFATPDLQEYYRTKPAGYIAYILQHEGKGWLYAELKNRGWINQLQAFSYSPARGFGFFYIDVELSKEGESEVENVILLIYEAIGAMKRQKPQKWLHDELKQLNEIFFRFQNKERAISMAQQVSEDLQHYSVEDVLYHNTRMDEFRPDLIEMVLDLLTPENMNYQRVSRQFHGQEGNEIEKWYGTEYRKANIDQSFMEACRKAMVTESARLTLPGRNDFIPSNFDLKEKDEEISCSIPSLIRDDNFSRVWFLQDQKFKRPRCCRYFKFSCIGLLTANPTKECTANIFIDCLRDSLKTDTYTAALSGLYHSFKLAPDMDGVTLEVWGYCEKQHSFISLLLKRFANFSPDPKRFEELKEEYRLTLKNHEYEEPREQIPYYCNRLLAEDRVWFREQLIDVIDDVTIETVNQFVNELLSAFHIETLIHGNATKQEALETTDTVLEILSTPRSVRPLFASELKLPREYRIEGGKFYVFEAVNETQPNSAVEILLQTGAAEAENVVLLEILKQILCEPMFDTLRTKEQLGYTVACKKRWSNGTIGLKFIIQGESDPTFLEERIENWLNSMRDNIEQMSDEEFQMHVDSLLSDKLEECNRLVELADMYWSEITDREYNFNRQENECEHLRKVTKTLVLNYFDKIIALNAPDRKKMVIKVYSEGNWLAREQDLRRAYSVERLRERMENVALSEMPKPQLITDVTTFRNSLTLDCRVKPAIDIRSAGKRYLGSYSNLSQA